MIQALLILLFSFSALASGSRPPIQGPALVAPIVIDNQRVDQAWFFPHKDAVSAYVEATPILRALEKYISREALFALSAKIKAEGVFSLAQLEADGLSVVFDEKSLDLIIKVPSSDRRSKEIGLIQRGLQIDQPVAAAAPYSGYLNLRGTNYFSYPAHGSAKSRQPFIGNLELVNNFHSFALEGGYDFTEKNEYEWRRADTSLVYDFESRMTRLRVGDIQTISQAYLSSRALGGISYSKIFSIQPYSVSRPISRTEILLDRPSLVEVFVNGTRVNQLRLPAGPVNLKDFPLSLGRNNVQLKIIDDLGRSETKNLDFLYDSQSLGKGIHEFSYAAGLPWTVLHTDRKYDGKNPTGTFFHRYGVSDQFTIGASYQGDHFQHLSGLEAVWVNTLGTINSQAAAAKINGQKIDLAALIRLQTLESYRNGEHAPFRVNLEAEYKGWRFASLGNTSPVNPYSWSLDAYSIQRLLPALDFGLGYRYQFARTSESDLRQARADLAYTFAQNWRSALNFSRTLASAKDTRFFFTLTWVAPSGKYYFNSSYETPAKTARVDMVRNPDNTYNDIKLAAAFQNSPDMRQAGLQADYIGSRADIRLDHQSQWDERAADTNQTGLTLASAIVWTNEAFSWSRPISDSFVILPRKNSLKDIVVPINSNGESAEAEANAWGPAVLSSVSSYYFTPVNIDTSLFPPGYTLQREYLYAKPSYAQGVTIPIGAEASLLVTGLIELNNAEPLSLASGEIKSLSEPAWTPRSFFTNRAGRFVLEGMKPGKYLVEFFEGHWQSLEIEVPDGITGLWKMKNLRIQKETE